MLKFEYLHNSCNPWWSANSIPCSGPIKRNGHALETLFEIPLPFASVKAVWSDAEHISMIEQEENNNVVSSQGFDKPYHIKLFDLPQRTTT